MAEPAEEYKERLLRQLNGDAFLAEKDVAFYEREIPFAETEAIAEALRDKMNQADTLAEFCKAAALALEDVEWAI